MSPKHKSLTVGDLMDTLTRWRDHNYYTGSDQGDGKEKTKEIYGLTVNPVTYRLTRAYAAGLMEPQEFYQLPKSAIRTLIQDFRITPPDVSTNPEHFSNVPVDRLLFARAVERNLATQEDFENARKPERKGPTSTTSKRRPRRSGDKSPR